MTTMSLTATTPSKSQRITGWVMSGFVILFLLFDSVIKFVAPPVVVQTTVNELGFQPHHIGLLGIIGLINVILYTIPRTAVLGAVLITAQLGGAIAVQVRVDNPLFSNELFPIYIGILMWGGLWMRLPSLRKLFPIIREE
ncbi:MAG: DoxX family protein [Chryseolinea sp.]